MKLKHFAIFVFRVLGALLMFNGFWTILLLIGSGRGEPTAKVLLIALIGWVVGVYLVYYSKFVAAIFCAGIDDDSA